MTQAGLLAKTAGNKTSSITPSILVINSGSSSIRFAIFAQNSGLTRLLDGKVDRIGLSGTNLVFRDIVRNGQGRREINSTDHRKAADYLFDWLQDREIFASIKSVGHRIVHGMSHFEPELVTPELISELKKIIPYDPDHLPGEISLLETWKKRHPQVPQVVCYDTAFHRSIPRVAKLMPIPRRYSNMGVIRYGFHGISYSYLLEELQTIDPVAGQGRVILAHLGNGASVAAVKQGKSLDTSMGFTPASGLMMGTRPGDLDPGLISYLANREQMTIAQFQSMINHESGLLGVSEISSDMRDLLRQETTDIRAAEAVAMFCYRVRKWIGSFIVALGGIDTLVFAGGIGENCPPIRARICESLTFLGLEFDEARNIRSEGVLSTDKSRVTVRMMHTDEELKIARLVGHGREGASDPTVKK